jgi:alanyl-tRNA synthetase
MMTSTQIRQAFLDFFKSKQHTLVPSASLLPDSPNLLFTNAGMNQFVPIFLGQTKCPYKPGRAADTQKCIRAGGKHNDLEDVGLDTYHHTFFEMLGNWSFGDPDAKDGVGAGYFKKEAIEWAWELVTSKKWFGFPPERLYATVYKPGPGEPSEFDKEACDHWEKLFKAAGLDPKVHVCTGGENDNFWMMGETGPCGPCSEIHVDLTPKGDTRGKLVNKNDPRCIEIWNLVFIQFNANADGTFSPLPAKHVDTGMGFERVTSIIQCTKGFKDFAKAKVSNYETDIFRPIFDVLEKLSGKKYGSTLPGSAGVSPASSSSSDSKTRRQDGGAPGVEQIQLDIAFRVIADHIRTLSFAIADGIQPGNTDRNYVLRRILRRAVRYGRALGFHEPFFYKLVDVLADTMGDVFPEIRARKKHVQEVIRTEEEAFNKTLDIGIQIFEEGVRLLEAMAASASTSKTFGTMQVRDEGGRIRTPEVGYVKRCGDGSVERHLSDDFAFRLYDTYGFPLDLTELMARERGLTVDKEGFEKLMEKQRTRARAAQKKEVIELAGSAHGRSTVSATLTLRRPTKFVGYDHLETKAKVTEAWTDKKTGRQIVVLDISTCYAEMGGQVGDTGSLTVGDKVLRITNTTKDASSFLHILDADQAPTIDSEVQVAVEAARRNAIQRHHTVTHLLHWALHEVVSKEASQKGSFVGPDKLTFDFSSKPLTPQQVADIEKLVNERIVENAPVSWSEVPYSDVKRRNDIRQFFGEKYGDTVRVLQIGGERGKLNGFSMELCGGTHVRATGEIGLFRIVGENAIAAGVRRIEAVAGLTAYDVMKLDRELIRSVSGKVNSPIGELEKKIENLLEQQKALEKQLKAFQQKEAAGAAKNLVAKAVTIGGIPAIIERFDADGDTLQGMVNELKGQFKGVIVLGGVAGGAVALVASVSPEFTAKVQAGKIIQQIAPVVGGKGGGKPDNARGGGKNVTELDAALAKAKELLKA